MPDDTPTAPAAVRPELDVYELCNRLVRACRVLGLDAARIAPTRVMVMPRSGTQGQVVICRPENRGDPDILYFWWTWGERIRPVNEITETAMAISAVVTANYGS